MTPFTMEKAGDDAVRICGGDGVAYELFRDVPEILRHRSDPRVRERLFPDIMSDDEEASSEWHETMDPELEHLFASAEEIVGRDLATIQDGVIEISAEHVPAWISALNQARIILSEIRRADEIAMEFDEPDPGKPEDPDAVRMFFYQVVLREFVIL